MSILQIVVKTVITTLDLIIVLGAFKSEVEDKGKKALFVMTLINLTGVWI
jgi:hypothetical protein